MDHSAPIPEAASGPTTTLAGASAPGGGDLGALVSSEALDALNTIQVTKVGRICFGMGMESSYPTDPSSPFPQTNRC